MITSLKTPSNTLFVTGNSTVGNQFLHSLLTADPQVLMGLGRSNKNTADQALFAKDQFSAFQGGVAGPQGGANTELSQAQLINAKLIWDIHPTFFQGYDSLIRLFPGARLVVVLQNILDICCTNDSAINIFESTPVAEQTSVESKVSIWNQLLQFTATHLNNPNVRVVVYEELISSIQNYKSLYQFLGLNLPKDEDLCFVKSVQRANQLQAAGRVEIAAPDKLKVLKGANFGLYQSILNFKQAQSVPSTDTVVQQNSFSGAQTSVSNPTSIDTSPAVSAGSNVLPVATTASAATLSTQAQSKVKEDSQRPANANLLPPLRMSEQDVMAAQRIFLSEETLTHEEVQELVGRDSFYVQSYFMNSKAFKSNPYNSALVTSMAKEIAAGIKAKS